MSAPIDWSEARLQAYIDADRGYDYLLARKRERTEQDFGAVIDATIQEHSAPRVEAMIVWPAVCWSVLWFSAVGAVLYVMNRG